ncbi:hypothetical protein CALCODRAFT_483857 [Calocera cornea HHB12733]|uniref:Uncharacterized protein n=1 Tax=Calocera cornea HHB12733 TaxID=1353952 RepID=A0A165FE56_9BASI|nr:hypothetical protein CALCODRAFT_483857 [Calocera cornea HHB12733]
MPFSVTSFPALSGGLPTKPDEAPSIVFCVLYALLLIPTLWRTITYRRPGRLLFTFVRLTLFVLVRIATFALRAQEAATAQLPNNPVPSIGIFIAEQILLGVGFIVLVDLMVELLKGHIWRTDVPAQGATPFSQQGGGFRLEHIVRLMHLALLVAIALGIAAGSMYSGAFSDPSKANTVKSLRVASTAITLAVSGLVVLVCLLLLVQYPHLGATRTLYLLLAGCLLVIVPAYRLSTSLASNPSEADLVSTATRVKFYVLQATMEWLVVFLLVLVDVRVWFFAGGDEAQMMLATSGKGYPVNQQPMRKNEPQYGAGYA